jgi:hypothetical protein
MKKKLFVPLALAGVVFVTKSPALSLDDIPFWIGSGTNRAALVIEWSTPESSYYSTVPGPIADKSLVWGYRFNDTATAAQMFQAVVASDPRLYAVGTIDPNYGLGIYGIGFHLGGGDLSGLTDGSNTNYFTSGLQTNTTVYIDAAAPLNPGDLYWGGWNGPNWELWTEAGDTGGFAGCPDRGTAAYWTPDNPDDPFSLGTHGQWAFNWGLSSLLLTNGSWIGFSVAAGEFEYDTVSPYFAHKHAPALPDVGITALVKNLAGAFSGGQWQAQFISCTSWFYTLERSENFQSWTNISPVTAGNGTNLMLSDNNPPPGKAFYRIRAERP